ncbi:hypothetical protein D9M70_336380 [compost metagenome]
MASPLQRMARDADGTSMLRESPIGLPMSRVSSRASSSAWASIRSAKRIMTSLRLTGARRDHAPDSNTARASLTASSASARSQLATLPSRRPSTGLMQSKVSPDTALVYSPWMKARVSICTDLARCSQSARVRVVIGAFLLLEECRQLRHALSKILQGRPMNGHPRNPKPERLAFSIYFTEGGQTPLSCSLY